MVYIGDVLDLKIKIEKLEKENEELRKINKANADTFVKKQDEWISEKDYYLQKIAVLKEKLNNNYYKRELNYGQQYKVFVTPEGVMVED